MGKLHWQYHSQVEGTIPRAKNKAAVTPVQCSGGTAVLCFQDILWCVCCEDQLRQLLWRLKRRWSLVMLGCTWTLQGMPPPGGGGYSLCDGWYICAAVLTPFFHFGRIEHDLFGVLFLIHQQQSYLLGYKTTNFYKNRSFWPQIQFFPRSFWVQFSAASGTPPSVFRPSTPPGMPPLTTKGNPNYKLITLLIIKQFLPLKFHIKVIIHLENYSAACKVIAKVVTDLAEVTRVLNFRV